MCEKCGYDPEKDETIGTWTFFRGEKGIGIHKDFQATDELDHEELGLLGRYLLDMGKAGLSYAIIQETLDETDSEGDREAVGRERPSE